MVRFRRLRLAALLMLVSLAGCDRAGGAASSLASPAGGASLETLVAASRDCLQYPVETRADGSQVWNADYFYFSLVDRKTHRPVLDADGKPLGDRLLASQAFEFMKAHPALEGRTAWVVQLARFTQVAKDGRELSRAGPVYPQSGYDLDSLLALDAAARRRD